MSKISVCKAITWVSILFLSASCARTESFAPLGTKIASPSDISDSPSGAYFYVLNSDFDRSYNSGSILTIESETGNKIGSLVAPRLGRSLAVGGPGNRFFLATFDRADPDSPPKAVIYDISTEAEPKMLKTWELTCSPVNGVMAQNYKHFAVQCIGGSLLMGTIDNANPELSDLHLVRNYQTTRRAAYIDTTREILFMFPTDLGPQSAKDVVFEDTKTFTNTSQTDVSNEIPDEYEKTLKDRRQTRRREQYLWIAYDIKNEASANFPLRSDDGTSTCIYRTEHRWLYFPLLDAEGKPDIPSGTFEATKKNYRTNFWEAQPSPTDSNSFYISQRGNSSEMNMRQVIRVDIKGDVHTTAEGNVPTTDSILNFTREYGFKNELGPENKGYPGDFVVRQINSNNMVIVNNFRDLSNWKRNEVGYGVGAKVLGKNETFKEIFDTNPIRSFYQLAVNAKGRGLSGLYYGNALILLDVAPETGITELKRID